MVRKSNMSQTKGKTNLKQISPETKIYVEAVNKVISGRKMLRVNRMKDLQTKENVKDVEAMDEAKGVESPESDCEILEISDGDSCRAVKRQSESDHHSDSDGKVRRVDRGRLDTDRGRVDTDRGRLGDRFMASRRRASLAQQPSLSSVQVLGVDLLYRPSSSAILFSTDSVLALLGASLPLDQHSLHSVVPGGKQDCDKEKFISWKALRAVLDSGLLDLAIRDLLLATPATCPPLLPAPAADTVLFASTQVQFKVRAGLVYLDVLSAFAVLERLEEAAEGNWAKVDGELAARGIGQKTAFKKRGSVSGRSYMTLEAFGVLAEGRDGLAAEVAERSKEVAKLLVKKDALCRELEQTVEMIVRTSRITPREEGRGGRACSKGETRRRCSERAGCGEGDEIIDLSESDAEPDHKSGVKLEDTVTSSGQDSVSSGQDSEGGGSCATASRQEITDTSEEEGGREPGCLEDTCHLLGQKIPLRVVQEQVFLGKAAVFKLVNTPLLLQKGARAVNRLLEEQGLGQEGAFIKGFVSTAALRAILGSESMAKFADRDSMLEAISNIEDNSGNFGAIKEVVLASCSSRLKYRTLGDSVFLHLAGLLRATHFFPPDAPTSKTNLQLCKLLSDRGVDTATAFLRQGKTKYAYISLEAGFLLLLSCDTGSPSEPGRRQELVTEIREALVERGVILKEQSGVEKGIRLGPDLPAIQFRVAEGRLFLHRKSCFELLDLESAVLSSKKGYGAINTILSTSGLEVSSCYLAARGQRYHYISCLALLRLLESKDPLIVCLARKDELRQGLLGAVQAGALAVLGTSRPVLEVGFHHLQCRARGDVLFLHRPLAYSMSGLLEGGRDWQEPDQVLEDRGLGREQCFLEEGEDRFGWISLAAMSVLLSLETEAGEVGVAWRDLLSAVSLQEPRLRQRMRMDGFRQQLLNSLLALYCRHLARETDTIDLTEEEEMDSDSLKSSLKDSLGDSLREAETTETDSDTAARVTERRRGASCSSDHVVPSSCPPSPALSYSLHSPQPPCLPSPTGSSDSSDSWLLAATHPLLTPQRYQTMRSEILAAAGGVGGSIGDWEVVRSSEQGTRLRVRPGYGASRKISFLCPDYAAILSYSLSLGPSHVSLTLNDSPVPGNILATLLEREQREGTLSFLYQLISLRPCFGAFSPELVETVRQWDEATAAKEQVYIDTSFIGTSGSGRTYAGTVRRVECGMIAADRVSDCCSQCRALDTIDINRSLLGGEQKSKGRGGTGGKAAHKSVWQLATTTEDACSFVCPQVQSFNTSLPHAFNSAAQATAVVEHRAEIGNNLSVAVELEGRQVARQFSEFKADRQLGPLLDWVAGLRMCVGYPANSLVTQTAFLQANRDRLRPELQKLFGFLVVDNKFHYSVEGEEGDMAGTIRSGTCLAAAEQGADICHQCRLLQEPIEFLNMP